MPPEVTETPVEKAPETPSEIFARLKAAKAEAQTPEGIAKAAEAAAAPGAPEKRASGDERKFRRLLSKRDQEIGELRARLDAAAPKPVAVASTAASSDKPLKREDFASDEAFADAKTAQTVQKALDVRATDDAHKAENKAIIDGYNARMAAAPAKYEDWDEVLKAGKGAALDTNLGKECPELFAAIAKSKVNDAFFYEVLKDSTKLQGLIDTYKAEGPMEAVIEFHRLEGELRKDPKHNKVAKAEVKAEPKKADDAVKVAPKPKPSAETSVRGGTAAPDGKPELFIAGTHTLNPAYKVWQRQQSSRN